MSVGCPSGIGPEVSVVAAAAMPKSARVLLVGDFGVIVRAARARRVAISHIERVEQPRFEPGAHPRVAADEDARRARCELGHPSHAGGAAQLAWIDTACDLVSSGEADALVTGPVSKDAIASSGARGARQFLGHTEHLQRRLHSRDAMMCVRDRRARDRARHDAHPDRRRSSRDHRRRPSHARRAALARFAKRKSARIAVVGLNPHAGEAGRIGQEEARIARGIALARRPPRAGSRSSGRCPRRPRFGSRRRASIDGVVAMYHDQATIPMKLIGFGDAVNVSLGLPIVRTSVDHGTAYDRAARFDADARGMIAAMKLAVRLVQFK